MDSQVDDDLIDILESSSPKGKTEAWNCLLGLTATEKGVDHIIKYKKYLPIILSSVEQGKETETRKLAYKCLINITNQEKGAKAITQHEKGSLEYFITNLALDSTHLFVEEKCYVLSNLSAHKEVLEQVIDVLQSSNSLLRDLVKKFCSNSSDVRKKYNFLALLFGNLTLFSSGRSFFLKKDNSFLADLLVFISNKEPEVRRVGCAITIKNCCFEQDHHKWLLNEANVLPSLLLPLMGAEDYDEEEMDKLPIECQYLEGSKTRDPSSRVRKILVHAISMLCFSEEGWNFLKSKGVYYVVREHHKWEKDTGVLEALENLASYLLIDQYSSSEAAVEESTATDLLKLGEIRDLKDFVI